MGIGVEELGCFFDRSSERGDGNPGPSFMELFNGITIGKHVDDLGNADTGVNNREFTAGPLRTLIKVFHDMIIVTSRLKKSNTIE
jgi:hypothetical protein